MLSIDADKSVCVGGCLYDVKLELDQRQYVIRTYILNYRVLLTYINMSLLFDVLIT